MLAPSAPIALSTFHGNCWIDERWLAVLISGSNDIYPSVTKGRITLWEHHGRENWKKSTASWLIFFWYSREKRKKRSISLFFLTMTNVVTRDNDILNLFLLNEISDYSSDKRSVKLFIFEGRLRSSTRRVENNFTYFLIFQMQKIKLIRMKFLE